MVQILVIGNGGREHAICESLAKSDKVQKIFVAPGNPGIFKNEKTFKAEVNINNKADVKEFCNQNDISLVAIGPEAYLADGYVDFLESDRIKCFGPGKEAAQIESDKDWAKCFMRDAGIPTARSETFSDPKEAISFLKKCPYESVVIKATGLAAGKGVIVPNDFKEAEAAIKEMLVDQKFGQASERILIEEFMNGTEISVLAFTDGKIIVEMPPAQDHKRIFDGDKGANTGGMGAYCPCPLVSKEELVQINEQILQRAIKHMNKLNLRYVGVLYSGVMLTKEGPKVVEFNCRFGDPETQVILPLLKSDLYEIMKACTEGKLTRDLVTWETSESAVGVILASKGYPESSSKGQVITHVEEVANSKDHFVFHSGTAINNEGQLVTNGGRVLIAVSIDSNLTSAAYKALVAAKTIEFEGKQFRSDIAHKAIARSVLSQGKMTYEESGVDITAGDDFVSAIKPLIKATIRSGTLGSIGGFGGLFDTKTAGYTDPILVSGTDGVGTKLKIAIECNKHDTVGIDLVAMCVNDILAHGAEPLFFLDYYACGKLQVDVAKSVVAGIVEGCKQAGCALVGGETAEMPSMYKDGDYDLAGFAVGAVERTNLMPRTDEMQVGDVVIGLPSSGVHSNGFSLVRSVIEKAHLKYSDVAPFSESSKTIGEELLVPTKIYTKSVTKVLNENLVKGFAHITGGGLTENIPRVLPDGIGVLLDASKWDVLPIFGWLAIRGEIRQQEMLRTFNCGIGAILICSAENLDRAMDLLKDEKPVVIGALQSCTDKLDRVKVNNFEVSIEKEMNRHVMAHMNHISKPLKKVGVLISGSGTNLQALINATKDPTRSMGAEIVLVISNKAGVEGLKRAERAGIPTMFIDHKAFPDRETFDDEMNKHLRAAGVEIICLAGFMRLLSKKFVESWRGAMLNVHPSLLPSFKGAHAIRDALEFGAKVTGCSVHFVEPEVDSGAIIVQDCVSILPNDTEDTLRQRIQQTEHKAFPLALELLANDKVKLEDGKLRWI